MFRATSRMVVVALIAGLAACSDGSVAPKSAVVQNVSNQGALAELTRTDTVRFSFVVNPAVSSSFYLGAGNSVRFPAGAVCDPATSTYGVTEWDNACTPATAPITINASAWLDPVTGNPRVDFENHIRFVPSTDPLQWVTLAFTWNGSASGDVSIELQEQGKHVLLTLVHRNLHKREGMLMVGAGWHMHLDILAARISGGEPDPFWDGWSRLRREYDARIPA